MSKPIKTFKGTDKNGECRGFRHEVGKTYETDEAKLCDCGAATAGDCGAATSRGNVSVGADGVGTVRGNDVRIRGGLGALLTIAEEQVDHNTVKWWKSFKIDGKRYRPDTWYRLDEGGKVVRCDDENAG